ncbi:MAG: 50S ribosomal protein L6 [Hyphomonadaceae bacterium]
MSRVGRAPVYFDKAVQVNVTPANEVVVKGAKHSMTIRMRPEIKAKIEDGKVVLSKTNELTATRAYH